MLPVLLIAALISSSEMVKEKRYILKVTESEVYLDVTVDDPVVEGQIFEVFRPAIEMVHPVTKEKIMGELPVGFLIITRKGTKFSTAVSTEGTPVSAFKEGDIIYLKMERKEEEIKPKRMIRKDLSLWTEYVMYNKKDMFGRGEIGFRYSSHGEFVYGIRFGLGGIYGVLPEETEEGRNNSNFYFGYSEFIIGEEYLTVLLKPKIGLDPKGIGYGFDGSIIIGSELGTYLLLGGMIEKFTGQQAQFLFQTPVTGRLSMYGHAVVENLPIGDRLGFRMLVGIIYFYRDESGIRLFAGAGGRTSEIIYPSIGAGYIWKF